MPELSTIPFAGVDFAVRRVADKPALFVFGVRKSGSSVMNAMVTALARMNGVNYVDVAGRLFEHGVGVTAWQRDPGLAALLHGGNVYGGFRNAPLGIATHPLVVESAKVLLVRDPRDALVSEYFSNAYSHSVPKGGEAREQLLRQRAQALGSPIADYALRMAPSLREALRGYAAFLDMPRLRIYRYEEAVMDKRSFLQDICAHFGWRVGDVQLSQILGWADVLPEDEDPTRFIRRVRPGDHLEKLDRPTIDALNDVFAAELARFGYVR
jgi:hypothetical protein